MINRDYKNESSCSSIMFMIFPVPTKMWFLTIDCLIGMSKIYLLRLKYLTSLFCSGLSAVIYHKPKCMHTGV